jgi:hypothetical protein
LADAKRKAATQSIDKDFIDLADSDDEMGKPTGDKGPYEFTVFLLWLLSDCFIHQHRRGFIICSARRIPYFQAAERCPEA